MSFVSCFPLLTKYHFNFSVGSPHIPSGNPKKANSIITRWMVIATSIVIVATIPTRTRSNWWNATENQISRRTWALAAIRKPVAVVATTPTADQRQSYRTCRLCRYPGHRRHTRRNFGNVPILYSQHTCSVGFLYAKTIWYTWKRTNYTHIHHYSPHKSIHPLSIQLYRYGSHISTTHSSENITAVSYRSSHAFH